MPNPEITQQMLTSRLLRDLPLLFTTGQTVFHPVLGICRVDGAEGARRRLVAYRRVNPGPDENPEERVWLDVGALQEFESVMVQDVEALSEDELDMRQYDPHRQQNESKED